MDIYKDIRYNIDLSPFNIVIICVCGNDVSSRKNEKQFISIYQEMIRHIESMKCEVYVSGITLRRECDFSYFNDLLRGLSRQSRITFISHSEQFLSNNNIVYKLIRDSDGIHFTNFGTTTYLRRLNETVKIFNTNGTVYSSKVQNGRFLV